MDGENSDPPDGSPIHDGSRVRTRVSPQTTARAAHPTDVSSGYLGSEGRGRRSGHLIKTIRAILFAVLGGALLVELLVWSRSMAGARDLVYLIERGASNGVFLAAAATLIGIGLAVGAIHWGEAYLATLVAITPVVPFASAVAILVLYLPSTGVAHADAILLGISATAGAWVYSAPMLRWMAQAETAQPRSFGELVMRTRRARTLLSNLAVPHDQRHRSEQANSLVEILEAELGFTGRPGAGFRYAHATGYMNLWRTIHRVEELQIALQPRSEAIAAAMYDAFRFEGLPNDERFINKIFKALSVFGPAAWPAVCTDNPPSQATVGSCLTPGSAATEGTSTAIASVGDQAPDPVAIASPTAEDTAIAVLADVRRAFNVYQDDTWERLIRQRNRLLRTVLITSTVGLLLVGVAVQFRVGSELLGAASAFYLVGALIGLFALLRAENSAGPAVDDFGLFEARLLATPLLSGLASIAGVVLVAFGPSLLGAGTPATPPKMAEVFSLTENMRGLLAAAIFGLTPELLIGNLKRQSDAVIEQLHQAAPTK